MVFLGVLAFSYPGETDYDKTPYVSLILLGQDKALLVLKYKSYLLVWKCKLIISLPPRKDNQNV